MKLNKFLFFTLTFLSSLTTFHLTFASDNDEFSDFYISNNLHTEDYDYQVKDDENYDYQEQAEIFEKDYSDVSAYQNFINYEHMDFYNKTKVDAFFRKLTNIFNNMREEYNTYPDGDYKKANKTQIYNFQRKLNATITQKLDEYTNNKSFCKIIENKELSNKRKKWECLFTQSSDLIQKVDEKKFPLKKLTFKHIHNSIHEKWEDHTFEAYDISEEDYSFLIHTMDFIPEKSEILSNYIINQDFSHFKILGKSNFDICPLISTSLINKITGGYTDNIDFAPQGFPIHLILSVDPKSIAVTEVSDAFSPAKGKIADYLNKISRRIEDTEEIEKPQNFVNYFSDSLTDVNKFLSPKKLLNKTLSPYNEVIIVGNPYVCFFNNYKPIKIMAIGISEDWFTLAPQYPKFKESAQKLEEFLNKTKLPLVYYNPKTPTGLSCYLSGKGNFEDMKKFIQREIQWGRVDNLIYAHNPSEINLPKSSEIEKLMIEYNSLLEKRKKILSDELKSFEKREDLAEAIQKLDNEIDMFHKKMM